MEDSKFELKVQFNNLDELEKLFSRAVMQEKELRKTLNEIESVGLDVRTQLDGKHIR